MKHQHFVCDQSFVLLAQRAVFWVEESCLIISDLHLGKSHHFRKSGVGIPKTGDYKNLSIIKGLIETWQPQKLLFLGDLFHSEANHHVMEVKEFFDKYPNIHRHLVVGNHDIMDISWYDLLGLTIHKETYQYGPFLFSHEPLEDIEEATELYNICGHIHPAVRLVGKGRQSITLPCFYFSEKQAILPAFGKFTGNFRIKPTANDQVFAIANRSIVVL